MNMKGQAAVRLFIRLPVIQDCLFLRSSSLCALLLFLHLFLVFCQVLLRHSSDWIPSDSIPLPLSKIPPPRLFHLRNALLISSFPSRLSLGVQTLLLIIIVYNWLFLLFLLCLHCTSWLIWQSTVLSGEKCFSRQTDQQDSLFPGKIFNAWNRRN